MKKVVTIVSALCFLALAMSSCQKMSDMYDTGKPYSRVVIFFFEGYRTGLDLQSNINAMASNPLPIKGSKKAVLYIDHTKNTPYLFHLYSDVYGNAVRDTLLTFPAGTRTCERDQMREIFRYINEQFPSDHYGAVFSSHGTGWLPIDYNPKVKSLGPGYSDDRGTAEMTVQEFAQAIGVHLDYLVLDACMMGCVETAYEIKGVCDNLISSCVEVPGDGFNYATMIKDLLKDSPFSLEDVCLDYFNLYKDSSLFGATVSLVDCRKIDALAALCRDLFDKYHDGLFSVDPESVQCFGQSEKYCFYDLEDILLKCGINAEEQEALATVLKECIPCKYATPYFMTIVINHCCGLSMYLPSAGSAFLNGYYKSLSWNTATQLVK